MCGVVPAILARETLRSPVASLSPWRMSRHRAFMRHSIVSPIDHSREISLSLHPSIRGLSRRPEPTRRTWRYTSPPAPNQAQSTARLNPDHGSVPAPTDTPITISWRPGRELSRYPCPGPIQSTNEPPNPAETRNSTAQAFLLSWYFFLRFSRNFSILQLWYDSGPHNGRRNFDHPGGGQFSQDQ